MNHAMPAAAVRVPGIRAWAPDSTLHQNSLSEPVFHECWPGRVPGVRKDWFAIGVFFEYAAEPVPAKPDRRNQPSPRKGGWMNDVKACSRSFSNGLRDCRHDNFRQVTREFVGGRDDLISRCRSTKFRAAVPDVIWDGNLWVTAQREADISTMEKSDLDRISLSVPAPDSDSNTARGVNFRRFFSAFGRIRQQRKLPH